jgi:hypothetical protein
MNWLKRNIVKWALKSESDSTRVGLAIPNSLKVSQEEDTGSVRFTLTPAVGGRILRVTSESHSQGKGYVNETTTYVIPSGEDVGARVTKIINLEIMK